MNDRIRIELVRVVNDGLVVLMGRTASDRWNLSQFGISTIGVDRNQASVKRVRYKIGQDFSVSVCEGGLEAATPRERAALGLDTVDLRVA